MGRQSFQDFPELVLRTSFSLIQLISHYVNGIHVMTFFFCIILIFCQVRLRFELSNLPDKFVSIQSMRIALLLVALIDLVIINFRECEMGNSKYFLII